MIDSFLQTLVTGSALLIGSIYLLGGLIVNLHLAKFGIVDYQILQVKYLVVGIIYVPYVFGIASMALLLGLGILAMDWQISQVLAVISILGSITLFWVWANPPKNEDAFVTSWRFWIIVGTLSLVFPVQALFKQAVAPQANLLDSLVLIEALLLLLLALLAQVYHYAGFYYGQTLYGWNKRDPIGVGAPVRIELAVDPAHVNVLLDLGVPIHPSGKCDTMLFLDETDKHYIIGLENDGKTRVLKVNKEIVKAILYPESADQAVRQVVKAGSTERRPHPGHKPADQPADHPQDSAG